MGVRSYRPTSPSRRRMSASDFADVTGGNRPEKKLTKGLSQKGGRNHHGHTAVRFKGGGHKRRYRLVDFRREKDGVPATVASIEYDPNRSSRIARLHYADGEKRYIIAPVGLKKGDVVVSAADADIKPGNCLPLSRIPLGTQVHNIELKPGKGGQIVRAAGTGAQIMAKEGGYVLLRLPSGELRRVLDRCRASVGQVGNVEHENVKLGKAGRKRWLGKKPHNRGVTMNPVDHPLGGGEGRSAGGRHPVTPWGVPTRGFKTRHNKTNNKYIVARRSKKKRG